MVPRRSTGTPSFSAKALPMLGAKPSGSPEADFPVTRSSFRLISHYSHSFSRCLRGPDMLSATLSLPNGAISCLQCQKRQDSSQLKAPWRRPRTSAPPGSAARAHAHAAWLCPNGLGPSSHAEPQRGPAPRHPRVRSSLLEPKRWPETHFKAQNKIKRLLFRLPRERCGRP